MADSSLTIRVAIQKAVKLLRLQQCEEPRLEAELLLAHLLNINRLELLLRGDDKLLPATLEQYFIMVARRGQGEPHAYVTGQRDFFGHSFRVNKAVLVPRPESELLVEEVLARLDYFFTGRSSGLEGLDLGTGSGILAITLAVQRQGLHFDAIDICPLALETARANAHRHGVSRRIRFFQGDYFRPLEKLSPRPRYDLIVANPPYVKSDEILTLADEVRLHEPRIALDGGLDGLAAYRHIFKALPPFLKARTLLMLEAGAGQQEALTALAFETKLFKKITWRRDLSGHPRVFIGEICQAAGCGD